MWTKYWEFLRENYTRTREPKTPGEIVLWEILETAKVGDPLRVASSAMPALSGEIRRLQAVEDQTKKLLAASFFFPSAIEEGEEMLNFCEWADETRKLMVGAD